MGRSRSSDKIITRLADGHIRAYDLSTGERGVLSPARAWEPPPGDDVVDHAAAADLRHAYYTTLDAVVCLASTGAEVWRSVLAPRAVERRGHQPSCVLSSDGGVLWVYRPDAMAGRDRPDQGVALDSRSGALVAQADLRTVGHGGEHLLHPTSGHVFLDVGEGQDGSRIYRAALSAAGMELFSYPWDDRCLIDLSPDGRHFMTVHHEQADMAIHACPGGEVVLTLPLDAFGHDPDEAYMEWCGGYLAPHTVIVTIAGETEDEQEWFRHYTVDTHSGQIRAEFDARTDNPYDVQPPR